MRQLSEELLRRIAEGICGSLKNLTQKEQMVSLSPLGLADLTRIAEIAFEKNDAQIYMTAQLLIQSLL